MIFCNWVGWALKQEDTFVGTWGTWKDKVMCPSGAYVIGMKVRFQKPQCQGDNTGLNGLKFLCKSKETKL